MPRGLKRFHHSGQTHFVTFCCYHRRPSFYSVKAKRTFEISLERVRHLYGLCVYGYVVMPEHVHLLLSEPKHGILADAIKSLKQGVARRVIGASQHFWQKRYYDFNIRDYEQFVEKLRYIHRNPVKRELCETPEGWEWSSFRHYATGCEGVVEIESDWTAKKRERAAERLCPAIELPHPARLGVRSRFCLRVSPHPVQAEQLAACSVFVNFHKPLEPFPNSSATFNLVHKPTLFHKLTKR